MDHEEYEYYRWKLRNDWLSVLSNRFCLDVSDAQLAWLDGLFRTSDKYLPEIKAWLDRGNNLACDSVKWVLEGEIFLSKSLQLDDDLRTVFPNSFAWLQKYARDDSQKNSKNPFTF